MKRTSRKPSNLSDSLHQRLNSYALAASAAGVGVLALAQPSEAKILYTPAHVVLPERSTESFYLDMNHGGVIHFTFWHEYSLGTTNVLNSIVQMIPHNPYNSNINRIVGNGNASALRTGAKIGPRDRFSANGDMALAVNYDFGRSQTQFLGAWANNGKGLRNRYLGLQFTIKGNVHYGWARVNVSKFRFTATLTGYAYETIPNKPIIAGKTHGKDIITLQPASLGHLARGVSAIPTWGTGGNR